MNDYVNNAEMQKLVEQAEAIKASGKQFSDVIDENGLQYVDLVQEGGGVLGIGLVGYTYILEKAGIRFFSLAGTSAGSINTLLIASLGKIGEPVSEDILDILSEQDLFDFVDGPKGIKKLIQRQIDGKGGLVWGLIKNARSIFRALFGKLGINPGDAFTDWLTKILKKANIHTNADLAAQRKELPNISHRENKEFSLTAELALVTSEITTHTKVDFPRMAPLYWKDTNSINPALFARASMSIPYFFYPFMLRNIPNAGKKEDPRWDDFARYYGEVPPKVRFVDGGMLSNFPIGIFHNTKGIPSRPTFGVRLSTYRQSFSNTDKLGGMSGAMISTMRQIFDYDFILKHPDFRFLICNIDADQQFNWLNFNMSLERKKALFLLGAQKGMEFIQNFDWDKYKSLRANMAANQND